MRTSGSKPPANWGCWSVDQVVFMNGIEQQAASLEEETCR